ncbi:hypothetical protein PX699_08390 [Sphingobium sp. H39-3-25]|uniref:hypothetical protein n=1 Tax=Sphingobium arseniciresistens TaxID=3030834 RepID=UPI0023BA2330|nr:hypothetical protein [Sphingobium arseniciresistens]
MDPTPYFIMGTMFGVAATLLIQAYARRTVRKALSRTKEQGDQHQQLITQELRERVRVLEQIITDHPRQLADRIEQLR